MRRDFFATLRRLPLLPILILLLFVACAVLAPLIAPHDPEEQSLLMRLTPPAWMAHGDWSFPLGTDDLGRDVLSCPAGASSDVLCV